MPGGNPFARPLGRVARRKPSQALGWWLLIKCESGGRRVTLCSPLNQSNVNGNNGAIPTSLSNPNLLYASLLSVLFCILIVFQTLLFHSFYTHFLRILSSQANAVPSVRREAAPQLVPWGSGLRGRWSDCRLTPHPGPPHGEGTYPRGKFSPPREVVTRGGGVGRGKGVDIALCWFLINSPPSARLSVSSPLCILFPLRRNMASSFALADLASC